MSCILRDRDVGPERGTHRRWIVLQRRTRSARDDAGLVAKYRGGHAVRPSDVSAGFIFERHYFIGRRTALMDDSNYLARGFIDSFARDIQHHRSQSHSAGRMK